MVLAKIFHNNTACSRSGFLLVEKSLISELKLCKVLKLLKLFKLFRLFEFIEITIIFLRRVLSNFFIIIFSKRKLNI